MKSRRSKKEIQALLNYAGVKFDSKGRPPSGWYRSTPGLIGIGIGRNRANCGRVWKPRGPFIPLRIKEYVNTVLAHKGLLQFFATFGLADAGGLLLGGVVIVVVLLAWHVLARDRWRIVPAYGQQSSRYRELSDT